MLSDLLGLIVGLLPEEVERQRVGKKSGGEVEVERGGPVSWAVGGWQEGEEEEAKGGGAGCQEKPGPGPGTWPRPHILSQGVVHGALQAC